MKPIIPTFLLLCLTVHLMAEIIYVGQPVSNTKDGKSWENAFDDLALALAKAEWGDSIWMTATTYYPSINNDRSQSFILKSGVSLFGGFKGYEKYLSEREENIRTTLSGNIGMESDSLDNSYTILYIESPDSVMYLDGLVIEHAQADSAFHSLQVTSPAFNGAGIYMNAKETTNFPQFKNCIFRNNYARKNGGAVYIIGGRNSTFLRFEDCQFDNNSAESGGGVYLNGISRADGTVSPVLQNCQFKGNYASQFGASFYRKGGNGTPSHNSEVMNCSFINNKAIIGAGYYMDSQFTTDSLLMYSNSFIGNEANQGSGIYLRGDSMPMIIDSCHFEENIELVALLLSFDTIYLKNSVFINNRVKADSTIFPPDFDFSLIDFANRSFLLFDALQNFTNYHVLQNCTFKNNFGSVELRGVHANKIEFINNEGHITLNGSIRNSRFLHNRSGSSPLWLEGYPDWIVENQIDNCLFAFNEATKISGGAINTSVNHTTINNSVFYKNKAAFGGNIIYSAGGTYEFNNCILWDNGKAEDLFLNAIAVWGVFYRFNHCIIDVDSCESLQVPDAYFFDLANRMDVQVEGDIICNNSLFAKPPLFRNPSNDDFSLLSCSPGINAGNTELLDSIFSYDLNGAPRVQDNQIDIGVYEQSIFDLTIDYTTLRPSSETAADGAIEITNIEGGIPPYQLFWETGDTTTSINQLSASTYIVQIEDGEGCRKEFIIPIDYTTPTNFVDTLFSEALLYPNPSPTNTIFLKLTLDQPSRLKLTWFNSIGQQLDFQEAYLTSQYNDLPLSLPSSTAGVYWLQIENEKGQTITKKVLIK